MAIYAVSDLHGRYDLWEKIKAEVQPDDILYSLGDNIDRGPDGIKIILDIMKMDNVRCIRGNHEMMAIKALPLLLANKFNSSSIDQWFWNGGAATWNQLETIYCEDDAPTFKHHCYDIINFFKYNMRDDYSHVFNATNNKHIVLLSHAGYTLGREQEAEVGWDRDHFLDKWCPSFNISFAQYGLWNTKDILLVHGHTPVQYLKQDLELVKTRIDFSIPPQVIYYCDGHKIDIDLGSIISNRAALLNLETLEVTYFESKSSD